MFGPFPEVMQGTSTFGSLAVADRELELGPLKGSCENFKMTSSFMCTGEFMHVALFRVTQYLQRSLAAFALAHAR